MHDDIYPLQNKIPHTYYLHIVGHANCVLLAILCLGATALKYRSAYLFLISLIFYVGALIINLLTRLHCRGKLSPESKKYSGLMRISYCRLLVVPGADCFPDHTLHIPRLFVPHVHTYSHSDDRSLWGLYKSRSTDCRSLCFWHNTGLIFCGKTEVQKLISDKLIYIFCRLPLSTFSDGPIACWEVWPWSCLFSA